MFFLPNVEAIEVAFYRRLLLSVSYIEAPRGCFKKVVLASPTPSTFLVPDSRLISVLSLYTMLVFILLSFTLLRSKEALVVDFALLILVGDLDVVRDGGRAV